MKRANGIILTLALLMVGILGAWAQDITGTIGNDPSSLITTSGMVSADKCKLTYKFTSGKITNKKEVRPGRQWKYECVVKPGQTISFSCDGTGRKKEKTGEPYPVEFELLVSSTTRIFDDNIFTKKIKESSVTYSYTVPENARTVYIHAQYDQGGTGQWYPCSVSITLNVEKKAETTTTPPTRWEPPSYSNCDHPDSHCRFEELWGEVSFRCNDQYDDSYETAEYQTVIKQEDRIQTKEESGAKVWVPDWDTYVNLKEETTVVIRVEEQRIPTVIEMVAGGIWGNIKKMAEGKSIECEMSHCIMGSGEFDLTEEQWRIAKKYRIHPSQFGSIDHQLMDEPHAIPASYVLDPDNSPTFNNIGYTADDDDIVFACEIKNGAGTAYVFRGEMTLRNKNDKTYKLKAGQAGTLTRDGKITVKKFDANKIAKKFGIPMSEIRNHYSNTTTTATTRRYELERAIVKYKVTRGSQQGTMAKAFDMYGEYERRELRMDNQTSIALTTGGGSYALNKNKKTAQRTQDADLNFLDFSTPLMKKLNLQKKGTAKVLNKDCTIYTGSNTEYYVWKGLVLKKVQKESNGTTTIHEATSIEEPTSVDPTMFKLPSGYTVK